MPAGPRIRHNNVYGTVSDNPLLIGAVSFTSLGLSLLPAVSGQHAVVVLDPKRVFGEPEIVVVTSHLAMGTTATITRGQYGTTAREHPQGTVWAHVPVDEDWIEIVTSVTRPGDPYEGQFIFETDTNKLVGYGGVDWAPRDAGGQLGYAQVVANQGPFTSLTDLTSLTVTISVGTGRRIKITGYAVFFSTVSSDQIALYIREGATILQTYDLDLGGATEGHSCGAMPLILTPTAGSHTYKLSAERTVGTGNITMNASATKVAFILAEDIGAV